MQVKDGKNMCPENVYSSICPGCGLACGLYLRENISGTGEPSVSVDFRKSSPVNAGKLCRFGLKLPLYYAGLQTSIVKGQNSGIEGAVSEAIKVLKTVPAESLAFFSVGNTTNEEQKVFSALAGVFGLGVETGMGIYSSLPARMIGVLNRSISLEEVENAGQIFLFVDPYSQYPLLLRRILRAKEKGAEIICIGPRKLPLADKQFCLKPAEYMKSLCPSPNSVIIADIHPYSDPEHIKVVIDLAEASGSKTLFLKPFVNSAGMEALAANRKQRTLKKLLEDIDSGKIKTLFCLESDLLELAPDREAAVLTLSKLDTLIVQTSRRGEFSGLADIVIASEPFYRKQGTALNAEGRLLSAGGNSTIGFDALSSLAETFGKQPDFESVQKEVYEGFGIKEAGDFALKAPFEPYPISAEPSEAETSCLKCKPSQEECCRLFSETCTEPGPAFLSASLVYSLSPFMWHGLEDDNDFVELNLQMVRKLGLKKGGTVKIRAQGKMADIKFRVSDIENCCLLSAKKLPVASFSGNGVELSR
ncbi:hypothetical protein RSJ42_03725 [Methanosarcina hadiensis]|uniref:hypothetical protein n=1 Tax=Methanosarcina hadiensis TaxID=3078083 RepID=UPI0039773BD3